MVIRYPFSVFLVIYVAKSIPVFLFRGLASLLLGSYGNKRPESRDAPATLGKRKKR